MLLTRMQNFMKFPFIFLFIIIFFAPDYTSSLELNWQLKIAEMTGRLLFHSLSLIIYTSNLLIRYPSKNEKKKIDFPINYYNIYNTNKILGIGDP